jgi:hypothetical protein
MERNIEHPTPNIQHPMSDKGEVRVKDFVLRAGRINGQFSVFAPLPLCVFALNVFRMFRGFSLCIPAIAAWQNRRINLETQKDNDKNSSTQTKAA